MCNAVVRESVKISIASLQGCLKCFSSEKIEKMLYIAVSRVFFIKGVDGLTFIKVFYVKKAGESVVGFLRVVPAESQNQPRGNAFLIADIVVNLDRNIGSKSCLFAGIDEDVVEFAFLSEGDEVLIAQLFQRQGFIAQRAVHRAGDTDAQAAQLKFFIVVVFVCKLVDDDVIVFVAVVVKVKEHIEAGLGISGFVFNDIICDDAPQGSGEDCNFALVL